MEGVGGLAKIDCEGRGFNFEKLNCILVLSFSHFIKIVLLHHIDCTFMRLH